MTEQINNIYHNMNKLHNETMNDIESLKEDVNKLKSSYSSHLAVGEALKEAKNKNKISQKQKLAIVFGIVPIMITIYTLFMNR
jgi:hypothetical protein